MQRVNSILRVIAMASVLSTVGLSAQKPQIHYTTPNEPAVANEQTCSELGEKYDALIAQAKQAIPPADNDPFFRNGARVSSYCMQWWKSEVASSTVCKCHPNTVGAVDAYYWLKLSKDDAMNRCHAQAREQKEREDLFRDRTQEQGRSQERQFMTDLNSRLAKLGDKVYDEKSAGGKLAQEMWDQSMKQIGVVQDNTWRQLEQSMAQAQSASRSATNSSAYTSKVAAFSDLLGDMSRLITEQMERNRASKAHERELRRETHLDSPHDLHADQTEVNQEEIARSTASIIAVAQSRYSEGVQFAKSGDKAHAEGAFLTVLGLVPRCVECWRNIGIIRSEANDAAGAEAAYMQGLKLNDSDSETLSALGGLYNHAHRLEEADAVLTKATTIPGASWEVWFNSGAVKINRSDFAGALRSFEKAIELNPSAPDSRYYSAIALINSGRIQEAAQRCKEYLGLAPTGRFAARCQGISALGK